MPTQKRAKELARAKYERQQARRAATTARRRRIAAFGAIGGAVLVVVILLIAVMWPSGEPTASPESSPSATGQSAPAGVSCAQATPTRQPKTFKKPSAQNLKPGATIVFNTNCGTITVALAVKQAPQTTNAIAFLAANHWYNGNGCHRLTTEGIFVLQCGSPSLDGMGGPGFKVPDENLPKNGPNDYPAGTVAMANSGPGTSGSQLFFVYKDTTLPASYSILGTMASGLDVVQFVAAQGLAAGQTGQQPGDGKPAQTTVIQTTTLGKTG